MDFSKNYFSLNIRGFFDLVENIQNDKKNIKYFYYEYQGFLGAFFGKILGLSFILNYLFFIWRYIDLLVES
jgi:hypothetical protein